MFTPQCTTQCHKIPDTTQHHNVHTTERARCVGIPLLRDGLLATTASVLRLNSIFHYHVAVKLLDTKHIWCLAKF